MTGAVTPSDRPVRHELHPLELLSMAGRTLRAEPARVVVPAIVIFALDALQGTIFTQLAVDHLGLESVGLRVRLRRVDVGPDLLQRHARAHGRRRGTQRAPAADR